jgi:predicted nucleic acid-binding protein
MTIFITVLAQLGEGALQDYSSMTCTEDLLTCATHVSTANGEIDSERGRMALVDLADLPLRRYPHDFLLPRIWDLRSNLTAYDAAYVALAEVLDTPLLTRDRRLAAAAGHHAQIELV